MDYDPYNSSLDYSKSQDGDSFPSHMPSLYSEPLQEAEKSTQKEFFFFPEET